MFITIQKNIGNFDNKFFTKIKLIIPDNVKKVLKEKIFVYSYINILQNEISKKDKNLIDLSYKFSSTHGMYFKKLIDKKIITSKNENKYHYTEFQAELLPWQGPHGYFNLYNENIFLISKLGIINFGNIKNLDNENFYLNILPSNLFELVNYRKFLNHIHYGVKGLLIDNNQIYVSLIYQLKEGCYNTSIFVAKEF